MLPVYLQKIKMKYYSLLSVITFSVLLFSCGQKAKPPINSPVETQIAAQVPAFNSDSAYLYIKNQVDFGPRVPNTPAHVACGDYFVETFKRFGATVTEQKAALPNYEGKILNARNIIASFHPESPQRILLFAHWDTRPYADHDSNPANHQTPIDGANDGASGCGVLLEIARQISIQQTNTGIDIIFFDAEDWGVPAFEERTFPESGYCLGSDYWSKNPHIPNYTARYGILLDMVGAPNATFYKETYSMYYGARILNKVWQTAQSLGYAKYFINAEGGIIEDDHVHVIEHRKIPCIDIIHHNPNDAGFGSYWHTLNDTMDNISKETLQAVGETLLQVIYNEK